MAEFVRVVHLTVGEPVLGLWCDRCMTSAGFRVSIYVLSDEGVTEVATAERCFRCDRRDDPDD